MRWLWLHKTDPGRPWANLPIQVPIKARSFFSTILVSEVGNGASTPFWTDKWLLGQKMSNLAPRLFAIIPERTANKRTVLEALTNRKWIYDIKGALSVGALVDYLNLWELLSEIVLQHEVEDKHIFSIAADGKYLAKSAYKDLFAGSTFFGYIWFGKHRHLLSVNFSFGWLQTRDVGLLIGLLREVWITQLVVSYVIRKLKLLTISLSLVCSQECSGLTS
jgi:hypothetical protein